jgi:hypothetical protein
MDLELYELSEKVMMAEDHLNQFVKRHTMTGERGCLLFTNPETIDEYHRLILTKNSTWDTYMRALERGIEYGW